MSLAAKVLVCVVALLHVYFMVLEMLLWTKPRGLRVFGQTLERAQATAVLAANQGLYNGFLAAGLAWSLLHPDAAFGRQIALFFLGCVAVAGVYGGRTVNPKIFVVQSVPALLGLAALLAT